MVCYRGNRDQKSRTLKANKNYFHAKCGGIVESGLRYDERVVTRRSGKVTADTERYSLSNPGLPSVATTKGRQRSGRKIAQGTTLARMKGRRRNRERVLSDQLPTHGSVNALTMRGSAGATPAIRGVILKWLTLISVLSVVSVLNMKSFATPPNPHVLRVLRGTFMGWV